MKRIWISVATGGLLLGSAALAFAGSHWVPPVKDAATAKECSACHMLYPPALLPARSWQSIMGDLKNHFGDNAELDDATRQKITDYLVANAAEGSGGDGRRMRGIPDGAAPLRITQSPWFLRKHDKKGRIAPETLARRGAKSAADCQACHRGAASGYFDGH